QAANHFHGYRAGQRPRERRHVWRCRVRCGRPRPRLWETSHCHQGGSHGAFLMVAPTVPTASGSPGLLPGWARSLADLYESNAASQFIVYGNISDRMVLPTAPCPRLGGLSEFLLGALLPRFDVVLSYDLGNGIRVEKGAEAFSKWPHFQESQKDWKAPRPAVETLTRYFRYCAHL